MPGMSVQELQSTQTQLAAAMGRMPIWHVVVDSIDRAQNITVSAYFMQNLDELAELARACLVEFLTEDRPDELEEAIQNPQFQSWARQWYLQSKDFEDDRSIRYICRLPGCNVLTYCIRNDFPECCRLLLDRYSDLTAKERWLVMAEPMKPAGMKYKGNSLHEAAYCGSAQSLKVLLHYVEKHGLDWKAGEHRAQAGCQEVTDGTERTALQLANDQAKRGRDGAARALIK